MSKKDKSKDLEREVIESVSTLISFIKSSLTADLVEGNNKNSFKLDEDQLKKVNYIVNASVDKSFTRGFDSVIKAVEKLK